MVQQYYCSFYIYLCSAEFYDSLKVLFRIEKTLSTATEEGWQRFALPGKV